MIRVLIIVLAMIMAPVQGQGFEAPTIQVENRASYFTHRNTGTNALSVEATWESVKLARGVFFTINPYARYESDVVEPTVRRVNDNTPQQPAFGFHGLYVDVSKVVIPVLNQLPGSGRLRVGWQLPEWGVTDRITPTNLLAAHDYTDVTLDDRRVSQLGVSAKWAFDNKRYTMEFVGLSFTPARIPEHGPWGVKPAGVTFVRRLPTSLGVGDGLQVGARGCYNGMFNACLMMTAGRDKLFFTRPLSPTIVELVYPQMRGYGGDFLYRLPKGFIYRLEGVYRDYDGAIGEDYGEIATSLERIWGDNIFTLVEYVRQVPKRVDANDIHCVFSEAVLGRVGYGNEVDGWYGQVEGAANIDPNAFIVEATVTGPTPLEGLRFKIGYRVVDGSLRNLIGAYFRDSDGLFLDLVWRR